MPFMHYNMTEMRRFFRGVINNRKWIVPLFIAAALVCGYCRGLVAVNYDMNDYLPEHAPSSVALDVMSENFDGAIPNARVMVKADSVKEVRDIKKQIADVDGVIEVTWLDDSYGSFLPLHMYPKTLVKSYYTDGHALLTVTIDKNKRIPAVNTIREICGDDCAMTGSAVSTAVATESTIKEVKIITILAVLFGLLVLVFTTASWVEPLMILFGLIVAVLLNAGTHIIFGEISFVTNAAGNILQMAVSLDYSVFLIHRYEKCRRAQVGAGAGRTGVDTVKAMEDALVESASSILSSGLTTVIGFAALITMQFLIGPDLGLALAKGILISLITVFLFVPGLALMLTPLIDCTMHRPLLPSFTGLGRIVAKAMVPLALVFCIIIGPAFYFSTQNDYFYGASHIFGPGTQYGDDTQKIRDTFGVQDTYVLLIPKDDAKAERALVRELKDMDNVISVTGMTSLRGFSIPSEMMPSSVASQLESQDCRRMLLSVSVDYEGTPTWKLVRGVRAATEKYYPGEYFLAGEGVSTYDLKTTVSADMIKVNLIAICAVLLILMLLLRGFVLPVILVTVIETAIWINFALPFFAGKAVFYTAYLIVSSIQLGATVDYAILFTMQFRKIIGADDGSALTMREVTIRTIAETAPSIFTSGVTMTVVGFLLYFISSHGVISQLGYFLGAGTLLSMTLVFFVLPGLLGLYYRRRKELKR